MWRPVSTLSNAPFRRAVALMTVLGAVSTAACTESATTPPDDGEDGPTPEGPVIDGVRLRVLSESLHHPTAIAIVADGSRMYIAERTGDIRIIEDGELLEEPLLDLTDRLRQVTVEQGLLGLVLHPDFESNGFFYVNYTALDNDTQIVRFRIAEDDPNAVDPESEKLILEVPQPGPRHNGGNLVFGPDGMLYIGMGESDAPDNAQDTGTLLGGMLRIDVDGGDPYAIPPDNPYVGGDGRGELWAIGLRNPWRWSFDPPADRLIIADVGSNLWEEVNIVPAGQGGLNYGWPDVEGTTCRAGDGCPEDTVEPILTYDHDDGSCAIVGGYVYRGDALPALRGHYFYGDNCQTWLRSFDPSDPTDVRTWDFEGVGQTFSFGIDSRNELYVLTIDGAYRLEPAE